MARANVAVTLEEERGWTLRLLGGGGEPPPPLALRQKPPPDPAAVLVQELGDMPSPGPLELAAGLGSPSTAWRESPAATARLGSSGARRCASAEPAPGSRSAGLQDQQPAAEHATGEAPTRLAAAAGTTAGPPPGAAALPPALAAVQAASECGGEHSSHGQAAEAFANAAVAAALADTPLRRRQGAGGMAGSGSLDDVSPLPSPTCTAAAAAGGGGQTAQRAGGSLNGGGDGAGVHSAGGGDDRSPPPELTSGREGRSMDEDEEDGEDADEAQQQQQFDTQ